MHLRRALPLLVLVAACGGTPPAEPAPAGDPGKADAISGGRADCTATFRWLQKDAYASRAGRTSDLWPPHTTTVLDVACGDSRPRSIVRENHGTSPGQKDADGQEILVEVKRSAAVPATASQIDALVGAYRACECAPATAFLSMDDLGQDRVAMLLRSLASYVEAHMICDGLGAGELGGMIAAGSVADAVAALSSCVWDSGDDWATGFQAAAQQILGAENDRYHVCNNDAELEAALWDGFAAGREVTACDAKSPLCLGPKWFYAP